MKCFNCGNKTDDNTILCPSCTSVDNYIDYLTTTKCNSFTQMKDATEGLCRNSLLCEPIKRALKKEPLITRNIGHLVCPYPINLSHVIYGTFKKEELEKNYGECFD